MISADVTFDGLLIEQCRRRREALIELRELNQTHQRTVEHYSETCRALFQVLDRTPLTIVVGYERHANFLLDAQDGLRERLDQLTNGNCTVRLRFEGELLTRSAFAKLLVKRHDPSFLQSHPDCAKNVLINHAAEIINESIDRVGLQLAGLRRARHALVDAARILA
jgi:hypothetical protein